MPGDHIDVLFTTRIKDLYRLGTELMDVPPMPTRQGVQLLLHGYSEEDVELYRADAEQIVERFGGLALAIDQAAAYIKYKLSLIHI